VTQLPWLARVVQEQPSLKDFARILNILGWESRPRHILSRQSAIHLDRLPSAAEADEIGQVIGLRQTTPPRGVSARHMPRISFDLGHARTQVRLPSKSFWHKSRNSLPRRGCSVDPKSFRAAHGP
jgi:hypothetical protein